MDGKDLKLSPGKTIRIKAKNFLKTMLNFILAMLIYTLNGTKNMQKETS